MFEKSPTFSRFGGERKRVIQGHLGYVPELETERPDDRRVFRTAVALAVAAHVGFFLLQLPALKEVALEAPQARSVYVVQQVRFAPPPPRAEKLVPKRTEKKKIVPIPDPTPDDPEPIRLAEVEVPEVELTLDDVVFGIPEGPTGEGPGSIGPVLQLTGDISPPEKIFYPTPKYTEEGRQARVQGVVILEAIVDALGNVSRVKVLKGLPYGLGEAAAETAREWKFRPAKQAGQPVAVFLNLTIRFSLQ